MRSFSISRPVIAGATLLLAATACSSSSALPPAVSSGAGAAPAVHIPAVSFSAKPARKQKPLLYVAVTFENEVLVFDQGQKGSTPRATITSGLNEPEGITTDKSGNLYVANQNSVTIYSPGATSPSTTITTGVNSASDVAVDAGGNIYVTNNGGDSGQQWINFYPAGSTSPTYTWYPPQSSDVLTGIALIYPDATSMSDFYVSYFNTTQGYPIGSVLVCAPSDGCLPTGLSMGQTGGITVESSGSSSPFDYLAVDDTIPGFDNVVSGKTTQFKTGGFPDYLTFNSDRSALYISNESKPSVVEYAYPSMSVLKTIRFPRVKGGYNFNVPAGVAVSPPGTYN
ncbi:MAG TPA: hypothetical protein VHT92_12585 [Candidatus Cybelea sp.]|jgi:hypothetical protein|nr:hypothetical protein [Candidatus Cybelea sp.]